MAMTEGQFMRLSDRANSTIEALKLANNARMLREDVRHTMQVGYSELNEQTAWLRRLEELDLALSEELDRGGF